VEEEELNKDTFAFYDYIQDAPLYTHAPPQHKDTNELQMAPRIDLNTPTFPVVPLPPLSSVPPPGLFSGMRSL